MSNFLSEMKWLIIGILSGLAIGIGAGIGIGFGVWGNTSIPVTTQSISATSVASSTQSTTTRPVTTTQSAVSSTFPPMPSTFPPMPIVDTRGISKMSCPYNVTRETKFNLTWTPSTSDEVDAMQRIQLIMEGALLYYKCYTNITIPNLIIVYVHLFLC